MGFVPGWEPSTLNAWGKIVARKLHWLTYTFSVSGESALLDDTCPRCHATHQDPKTSTDAGEGRAVLTVDRYRYPHGRLVRGLAARDEARTREALERRRADRAEGGASNGAATAVAASPRDVRRDTAPRHSDALLADSSSDGSAEEEEEEEDGLALGNVPAMCQYSIAGFCGPDDVLLLMLTCRLWREIGKSESLWFVMAGRLDVTSLADARSSKNQRSAIKEGKVDGRAWAQACLFGLGYREASVLVARPPESMRCCGSDTMNPLPPPSPILPPQAMDRLQRENRPAFAVIDFEFCPGVAALPARKPHDAVPLAPPSGRFGRFVLLLFWDPVSVPSEQRVPQLRHMMDLESETAVRLPQLTHMLHCREPEDVKLQRVIAWLNLGMGLELGRASKLLNVVRRDDFLPDEFREASDFDLDNAEKTSLREQLERQRELRREREEKERAALREHHAKQRDKQMDILTRRAARRREREETLRVLEATGTDPSEMPKPPPPPPPPPTSDDDNADENDEREVTSEDES